MKAFAVLSMVVLSAVLAAATETKTCQADLKDVCDLKDPDISKPCTAKYAGALTEVEPVLGSLKNFAIDQLQQSLEFMLRASHFGNYRASRPGLAKLLRGLSDAAWNDAIALTKLVTERGGRSVFKKAKPTDPATVVSWTAHGAGVTPIAANEVQSLGRALDSVKHLATAANGIHHRATHHKPDPTVGDDASRHQHDAHIAHYVQEEFSGRYAKEIRALAGHTVDLKHLLLGQTLKDCVPGGDVVCAENIGKREKNLSLFLFDEYLLKL